MKIITLTSDWGLKDHYLAALKGNIMANILGVVLVDISHEIEPFNLRQASYIIKNCFRKFPEGTIHFIGLDNSRAKVQKPTVVEYQGHFFIGRDNGIFSLIFDTIPELIFELDLPEENTQQHDDFLGSLIRALKHLTDGLKVEDLGRKKEDLSRQLHFQPVVSGDIIRGLVIYIDNYENVVTNITREVFNQVSTDKKFTIECRGEEIKRISKDYGEVPVGEIVAIFNQAGHLEIAINQGNAGGLLGLSVDDPVSIVFK
jgi:S-adenosylmethionine hydrolase